MSSHKEDKEEAKELKGDHEDVKHGEEESLESFEDQEEEIEDDPRSYPRATIASIKVKAKPFKIGARMRTGGKVPRGSLAEKNSSPCFENPFRNLLHSHQLHNTPKSKLPTFWDVDRSDSAGKGSFGPEAEERWGGWFQGLGLSFGPHHDPH